ncbi:unnamed protein product [Ilex paraguariensis]|uniref:PA domain-containing protein n=1 Tax=Ilex paraguariensis TaxID=185542 RepID=A0ABC8THY2_9AQUA
MASSFFRLFTTITLGILLSFCLPSISAADDISQASNSKNPNCSNPFRLVKVNLLVHGVQNETLTGMTAAFGGTLPNNDEEGLRLPVVFSDPIYGCSSSSSKLSGAIALAIRGDCNFMIKAEVAQSEGASGLLVINDDEDLIEMGCSDDDTNSNITIPVVMISKSGGEAINKSMVDGGKVVCGAVVVVSGGWCFGVVNEDGIRGEEGGAGGGWWWWGYRDVMWEEPREGSGENEYCRGSPRREIETTIYTACQQRARGVCVLGNLSYSGAVQVIMPWIVDSDLRLVDLGPRHHVHKTVAELYLGTALASVWTQTQ